ncbi:hypothetical protein PanWU01x14_094840, partial [Parasponia andersonii]
RNLSVMGTCLAIDGKVRIDGQDLWILVVSEYSKVLPEDLSGLPLDREIEFHIELVFGA